MVFPETVIAGEAGIAIWPSKTKAWAELSVIVLEPRVTRLLGGGVKSV